jgi:hypothetical protein
MIGPMAHGAADRSSAYTVGMINWLTQPIVSASDRSSLVTLAGTDTTPSVKRGWIIQEVADTIQGGANYPQVDACLTAIDQAGQMPDINYDGLVNSLDLTVIHTHLGSCQHDSTLDGTVGIADLLHLLERWGVCN